MALPDGHARFLTSSVARFESRDPSMANKARMAVSFTRSVRPGRAGDSDLRDGGVRLSSRWRGRAGPRGARKLGARVPKRSSPPITVSGRESLTLGHQPRSLSLIHISEPTRLGMT